MKKLPKLRKPILQGTRFGRLVVFGPAIRTGAHTRYRCKCDCGSKIEPQGIHLRSGRSKSCGCLAAELTGDRARTHGKSKSRIYRIWCGMKTRCSNKKFTTYKYYGGKGVHVTRDFSTFEKFYKWSIRSGYKPHLSIDRKNSKGNYSKNNCKWSTSVEQNRNKSSNRVIRFRGKTMCLMAWAIKLGVGESLIRRRLNDGWSLVDAMTKPIRKHKPYPKSQPISGPRCSRPQQPFGYGARASARNGVKQPHPSFE